MRRFIKTFTVKKHAQFQVVQDGDKRIFQVERLDAATSTRGAVPVGDPFHYENERDSVEKARSEAIGFARKLAAEAEQLRAVQGEGAEPLSAEEEAEQDERAAARAQGLSPKAQEAAVARRR